MKDYIKERVIDSARYMIAHECTVRDVAAARKYSKSSVYNDLVYRLPNICPSTAQEVREILQRNKDERHIRGGEATRLLYRRLKDAERKKM